MEQVEIDFYPRCDDGTLPPNSALIRWGNLLSEASERAYKPLAYNTQTRQMLEGQGFVDIAEQIIQIPFNSWPADQRQKEVGRWYNLGLLQGLEAMSLGPLTRMLNWSKIDVDRLVAEVKKEICSRKFHVYCNM